MEPKFIRAANGVIKGYKATQISDTEVHGFTAICTRPGHIQFHVRHVNYEVKNFDFIDRKDLMIKNI